MTTLMWADSQRRAYEKLCAVGATFFQADWLSYPMRPRFDPLIIGPSGMGKSHLVRAVAAKLEVPCLRVTHGEWMVLGARAHVQHTIQKIGTFIMEHERGIIHVDELDKARSGFQSEWSIAVFSEIFTLLDRMVPAGARSSAWDNAQMLKLRYDFWFVGSGTWQSLWEQSRAATIGFGDTSSNLKTTELTRTIRSAGLIPSELLNRFSDDFIFLTPADETDYRKAAKAFGLTKLARSLGVRINYAEAAEDGLGARWLERTQANLMIQAWRKGRHDLLPPRATSSTDPSGSDSAEDIPL